MRTLVIALALVLTGCGSTQAQSESPPVSGGDFLPAYLDMLQGKKQVGDDLWCGPARDLRDLLAPCDTTDSR